MRGPYVGWQGRFLNGESVILAREDDAPGIDLDDRMIRAVVAEFHLLGFRAAREPQQLVTETDAEHRQAFVDEGSNRFDCVVTRLRISGAVGQEYSVRLQREHFLRRGSGGHD